MSAAATRTGIANLPLHYGQAPRWLFDRMVKLAREITIAIVADYGPEEMLRRLSHPYWFQAFGCVLGYDWHSSGVTTVLCGALKEGIKGLERDLGFFVAGGKGRTSRHTPVELENWGELISLDSTPLVYASRMSAKVDSAAIQDGYQLYHHTFFFTRRGWWAVVQQGLNEKNRYARRYHWLGEAVASFVNEPHSAILSEARGQALNLVASESDPARYSFAHGGKDGIPYPVDKKTYDQSIELLRKAINRAKVGLTEKKEAVNRLGRLRMV
jgi:hypothetical protein